MTNLKLENRKNTTEKALEALGTLMNSFEFEPDIDSIVSRGAIPCVGDIGGDRVYFWTDLAEWRIENGELALFGWVEEHGYHTGDDSIRIDTIRKIDFAEAIKALEDVIKKYNAACKEKDAQIEKFLAICQAN